MKNHLYYFALLLLCWIIPLSILSAQIKPADRSGKLTSKFTSTLPEDTISIYPNPTSGLFEIQLNTTGVNRITLHDVSGRVIQSRMISANDKIIPFDFSENPSGVYVVKFSTMQGSYIRKVMKED